MNTRNRLLLTALLVVAALTVAGHAQAQTTVRANIPFNFSLRGQTMPRGVYTFVADGSGPWRTVQMRSAVGKAEVFVTLFEDEALGSPTQLTFHRFGHTYVLSEISVGGMGMDLHIQPTKAEREMAAVQPLDVVTVLASR